MRTIRQDCQRVPSEHMVRNNMSSRKWQESVILENIRTVILPENEFMTQYTLLKRIGSASVNGRKTPENLTKTPRIRWRGVRVRPE